jgi:hypothetical protein
MLAHLTGSHRSLCSCENRIHECGAASEFVGRYAAACLELPQRLCDIFHPLIASLFERRLDDPTKQRSPTRDDPGDRLCDVVRVARSLLRWFVLSVEQLTHEVTVDCALRSMTDQHTLETYKSLLSLATEAIKSLLLPSPLFCTIPVGDEPPFASAKESIVSTSQFTAAAGLRPVRRPRRPEARPLVDPSAFQAAELSDFLPALTTEINGKIDSARTSRFSLRTNLQVDPAPMAFRFQGSPRGTLDGTTADGAT